MSHQYIGLYQDTGVSIEEDILHWALLPSFKGLQQIFQACFWLDLCKAAGKPKHKGFLLFLFTHFSVTATVENPRGIVKKLSLKESVEGAPIVLRGSVRAPEGFSEGKPEAVKPRDPSLSRVNFGKLVIW